MYLSSIKVNGFKSFADPTHLRFEPGVTAVVGPNGCGKSNIADAIRWVLGEQSAKALRGGKMQDVIFEGTDRRKPLNLCEVTLILTDCEKELGSDFHEVEISRRVHREGGSSYFINGKACRLKDIQRLFMDTGVGRASYSIMAQGQIDQILSSKPEERRAVFEEAAGISKYKAQRREAMNKLALVETNLSRVTDIIGEISRQIGSLKRQASKAIRYKKLSHKLRHLDVGFSAYQHGELSRTLSDIGEDAQSMQNEADELAQDLEAKETRLLVSKEERQLLIQKVQDSQQAVFDLRSEKEQAANQAHLAEIKISSLGERIEQAQQEIASFQEQVGSMRERIDSHAQDKQLHLDVLGNSDEVFQERSRELAAIEAELQSSETQIKLSREQALQAEQEASRCRQESSTLEVEAKTAQHRLSTLEEESVAHASAQSSSEEKLAQFQEQAAAAAKRRDELQATLQSSMESVAALQAKFKQAQIEIQELDRQVAQKTARLKLLQQLQEKLEGYGEGAKALLKGKMQGSLADKAFAPIAANLSVKNGYEQAVEALLGSAVEAIDVGDAATVTEIFAQLEDRKLGRASLKMNLSGASAAKPKELPSVLQPALDFVKSGESQNALQTVLSACYVTDDMEAFLKWWEANSDFSFLQVASPKGELVDSRGIALGGYRKSAGNSILQREKELRQTKQDLEADTKKLQSSRAAAEAINGQLSEAEATVEKSRQELGDASGTISSLEAEIRNASHTLEDLKGKAGRLEKEKALLSETQSRAAQRLDEAQQRLAKEEETLSQSRAKIDEVEKGVESIRVQRDDKREALSQAKFDLQGKKEKLDMLNQGLFEIEQRNAELQRLIESKTKDIELWTQEIAEQEAKVEESKASGQEFEQSLEAAKQVVEETRQTLASIEEKVSILEKEQDFVRSRLDEVRAKLGDRNVLLAEKRSRASFIEEEMQREYGIDLGLIDWKFEIWKARQPVENLPSFDMEPEAVTEEGEVDASSETVSAEGESEEAPAAENPELTPAAPAQPTEEELEALDKLDWKKIEAETKTLRKRIQGMGAVNTDAIAEYGELRERHGFLKGQYDDLIQSREKLVDAIDEINATSREQFSVTFDQIRDNFKRTFETLFGGGKADLRLFESEDVLESGIDIVAQPPGTRLKSISLLSGGQRTMTAVGLLFAIYMVKPSPFCLLDELDAPLDESNIGRFTSLLRQFVAQSQFIIITHNKRTIAAAQAIYGVTMEEKGVSKVVSMKFHSEHEDDDKATLKIQEPAMA